MRNYIIKFYISIFCFLKFVNSFPVSEEIDIKKALEPALFDLSYIGEKVFLKPNPDTGKRLESWNATFDTNPEEFGEYAEGDIVFPSRSRNGLVAEAFRWKNGIVPFEIAGVYSPSDLKNIVRAMEIYKKYTCISFRPRLPTDNDYISIINGPTGCWSSVGRIGGKQELNLQSPYCTTKVGTPLHELMHAVGFLHEQNRYERDDYVSIAWQNIKKGHENNFNKAEKSTAVGFGVVYDFRSVMHYSNTAFSTNGQATIIPKDASKVQKMGQRDGFSRGDILKINAMYNCLEKTEAVIGNQLGSGNKEPPSSNSWIDAATGLISLFIH